MIRFVEQLPDVVARSRMAQRAHKAVVPKAARHIFQGAQMIAGPVLWRDQQHDHMHWLAVETVEWYAASRNGHRADQALDRIMLAMRDCHRSANPGRAQELALENCLDDVLLFP